MILAIVIVFVSTMIAIIYFRKDEVAIWDAISIYLQRDALNFKTKISDIFTPTGVILMRIVPLVAFLYIAYELFFNN